MEKITDLTPAAGAFPRLRNREQTLHLGDLVLHPNEYRVERNGKWIKLRKKEYQLLEFLARNKNKVMNRNTLLEYIWNYNVQIMTNTLEVHISSLRRKIGDTAPVKILQTVYGLGYRLCDAPNAYSSPSKYLTAESS